MKFAVPRIDEATDGLSQKNLTTMALHALDFVVPGQWKNITGFDNTIAAVTAGDARWDVPAVRARALAAYSDSGNGYQKALWLYRTVDTADMALGAATLARKATEKVPFLSFMNRFTVDSDTVQAVDLALKLTAEIVAFSALKGAQPDLSTYTGELANYSGESAMRFAALVCFDGLIPLGPDFVRLTAETLRKFSPTKLEGNGLFKSIRDQIPGETAGAKQGFITNAFERVQASVENFVAQKDLRPEKIFSQLESFIDVTDDKLDYVGALLDLSTDYFAHTGTQTVARKLIERVVAEG